MTIDEKELRRLVFVAQQRRMRSLALPIPMTAESEVDAINPATEAQYDRLHEAGVAEIKAYVRLLDYLEDCLNMRSEFRKD